MRLKGIFGNGEPKPIYIKLEEEDFKKLLMGEVVVKEGMKGSDINLVLSDIGWNRIDSCLAEAYRHFLKAHKPWYKEQA